MRAVISPAGSEDVCGAGPGVPRLRCAGTLRGGGWTGTGIWLGKRKMSLPEAHTDYIFSVIGEEFGLVMCMVILALYVAIVLRVLLRLLKEEDLFTTLAAAGLTAQLGGQAFINIMVNLQLFPSKGMTLPLVSYGGTALVTLFIGILASLFTAITVTRAVVQLIYGGRRVTRLSI